MSAGGPAYEVLAVRYAERETTFGEAYHRWSSYGEPDGPLTMSYYFWLLRDRRDPAAPPIVVDSGFEPARGTRMGRTCLCEPGEALERLGVDPSAVRRVIVSHLHYDHIGNLHLFDSARFSVAARELAFWVDDPVAARPQFALHTDPDGVALLAAAADAGRVDVLRGRAEIAPGITALDVGGHSPGQLVLQIAGERGPVLLAGDAVHYFDELRDGRPFGVFSDLAEMYRAYDLIAERAGDGATLVPGHDPLVMERFAPLDGDGLAVCILGDDDTREAVR